MDYAFRQVDVFGTTPFSGNPVAVILDAEGLTTAQMQDVSDWTNLSECTFVLAPSQEGADYRVRIFAGRTERPFAGHPTLGTAAAWADAGGVPASEGVIVQQCAAGLVEVRATEGDYAFAAPPSTRGGDLTSEEHATLVAFLGVDEADVVATQWVDNGPGWVAALLRDAEAVLAVEPRPEAYDDVIAVGVAGLHPVGAEADVEVRGLFSFVPGGPVIEDPITGSLNASLAQWFTSSGRLSAPYVARQGTAIGRSGRVEVTEADGDLWIAGRTTIRVSGTIAI